MIVLTSDCKNALGMSASNVLRSCSMKGITMKILLSALADELYILIQCIPHDNLADTDDILVLAGRLKRHNLTQTCDGEPMLLLVQLELLEGKYLARVVTSRTKDDAVRPLFNVI